MENAKQNLYPRLSKIQHPPSNIQHRISSSSTRWVYDEQAWSRTEEGAGISPSPGGIVILLFPVLTGELKSDYCRINVYNEASPPTGEVYSHVELSPE